MIDLLIYQLHICGALYAFTKRWQKGKLRDGFMAIGLIALLFFIGWALTGTIAGNFYPYEWNTIYFNRDTFSLVLLLIPESIFFYFYFFNDEDENAKPGEQDDMPYSNV